MAIDKTTFAAFVKDNYTSEDVVDLAYSGGPLFRDITKNVRGEGNRYIVPVSYGNPANVSHTFSASKANGGNVNGVAFVYSTVTQYNSIEISRQLMKQTATAKGAFWNAQKRAMDAMIKELGNRVDIDLYGNGGGAIGQIASISTNTVTLVNKRDAVKFERDQVIKLSTTDGTSGSTKAGSLTVSKVDRAAGVVTFTANVTTGVATAATSDYLFIDGSFGLACKGLAAILPVTAPTSGDAVFGVDRSVDPVRLAGNRIDGSGLPLDEALRAALSETYLNANTTPDVILVHPTKFQELQTTFNQQVVRDTKKDQKSGFSGLYIVGEDGEALVQSARNCPIDKAYGLKMEDWELYSEGEVPEIVDEDGSPLLRSLTADAFEVRCAAYYAPVCHAPGRSFVLYNI